MPTDEPSRAGFTKTGYPKGFAGGSPSRIAWWRATGMPLSRKTFLKRSLSIARAEAAPPARSATRRRPLTAPSRGRRRVGRRRSAAGLAADGQRHDRLGRLLRAAGGILAEDEVDLGRVGHILVDDLEAESRRLERLLGG